MSGRPAAVLFDWDGTLVDGWPAIHECMNRVLAAMGRGRWSFEETLERSRRSLRDSFPELFGGRWEEARDLFYSEYRALHLERLRAVDGAAPLIGALHGLGVRLGVVSNKSGRHLRAEAGHLGWDGFFGGRLVGAGDAERDKPAADPALLALEGTGVAPSRAVWFVGDTWVDVACGRAAGCHTALVGGSGPLAGEFAGHPPDARFRSLRELLDVVRAL